MRSAVEEFEAESDAFVAAHNLDKLSLGDAEMNIELAVCNASLADSKRKIRLHTEQAENLKQQTMQLTTSLAEATEELKGREACPSPSTCPSNSAGCIWCTSAQKRLQVIAMQPREDNAPNKITVLC